MNTSVRGVASESKSSKQLWRDRYWKPRVAGDGEIGLRDAQYCIPHSPKEVATKSTVDLLSVTCFFSLLVLSQRAKSQEQQWLRFGSLGVR